MASSKHYGRVSKFIGTGAHQDSSVEPLPLKLNSFVLSVALRFAERCQGGPQQQLTSFPSVQQDGIRQLGFKSFAVTNHLWSEAKRLRTKRPALGHWQESLPDMHPRWNTVAEPEFNRLLELSTCCMLNFRRKRHREPAFTSGWTFWMAFRPPRSYPLITHIKKAAKALTENSWNREGVLELKGGLLKKYITKIAL